jgi:hypothetical protein
MLVSEGKPMESVTATLSNAIESKLKVWLEELLPERDAADGGAQPLDLDELQLSLRASNERDPQKQRRSRAA